MIVYLGHIMLVYLGLILRSIWECWTNSGNSKWSLNDINGVTDNCTNCTINKSHVYRCFVKPAHYFYIDGMLCLNGLLRQCSSFTSTRIRSLVSSQSSDLDFMNVHKAHALATRAWMALRNKAFTGKIWHRLAGPCWTQSWKLPSSRSMWPGLPKSQISKHVHNPRHTLAQCGTKKVGHCGWPKWGCRPSPDVTF